jgi:error-prone DNA polymerase
MRTPAAPFAELHARSAFSFLEGASPAETMIHQAARLGYEAIAITDRQGFYGSARAHHAAKECGIRALVGSMLELPDGSAFPSALRHPRGLPQPQPSSDGSLSDQDSGP